MERAIEASVRLAEPLRHVRTALTEQPGILVAALTITGGPDGSRFDAMLAIEIGDGTRVEQAVVGDLGGPEWTGETLVLPVRWHPATHEHVLPAFEGAFELTPEPPGTRLCLRGAYTVPLGTAGRVGDRIAGRRLAQRVLDHHLETVATHLDDAARHASQRPGAGPGGFGSENYIG